jgi:DNA topoisomerase VI subunit B
MNIIQEITEIVIRKEIKDLEEVMIQGGSISELTAEIAKIVKEIGRELTEYILEETDKDIRERKERKKEWHVQKRGVAKTYQTILGEVRYKRTYYKHRNKNKFAYL